MDQETAKIEAMLDQAGAAFRDTPPVIIGSLELFMLMEFATVGSAAVVLAECEDRLPDRAGEARDQFAAVLARYRLGAGVAVLASSTAVMKFIAGRGRELLNEADRKS